MASSQNCVHVVSHGRYSMLGTNIQVPKNISLWQYTPPNSKISLIEAEYILQKGCNVVNPFYLIDRHTGEIYNSTYIAKNTPPSGFTKDLIMEFTVNEFEGFQMGIADSTGYLELPSTAKTISLGQILTYLSNKYPKDKVTPVIQSSCRSGTYLDYVPDVNEMKRVIEKCRTTKKYKNMLYLDIPFTRAYNPDLFFLTEDEKTANDIQCLIKENVSLLQFRTTEDIIAVLSSSAQSGGKRKRKTYNNKRKYKKYIKNKTRKK
mgnify:CR=1 FL=1